MGANSLVMDFIVKNWFSEINERLRVRSSQYMVSYSDPLDIRTNRLLSFGVPRPDPSTMLAPTLSAERTICLLIVDFGNSFQCLTTSQTKSDNFTDRLYTLRFSKLDLLIIRMNCKIALLHNRSSWDLFLTNYFLDLNSSQHHTLTNHRPPTTNQQ